MRRSRTLGALSGAIAFAALSSSTMPAAHAAPAEIYASFGPLSPSNSPFRSAALALGYDAAGYRLLYEAEVGALFTAFDPHLVIGPILRVDLGRLGAPYQGVDPIRTDAAWLAVREELALYRWPRVILWADEAIGASSIGSAGSYATRATWGVRGGLGLRIGNQRPAVRFRVGYSYAPTFSRVSDYGGGFDFGGIFVALDGVLRVD